MKICIIPARGGSKRIPRKNIRNFCGKPIIAWSIAAAQDSGLFDHVIVSTDDDEIAGVAASFGAEVPFRRPAALADDYTGTTAVVAHATDWAASQGWALDAVCCLYATAPFARPTDLQAGLELLQGGDWAYCFAAARFASPIFRAFHQTAGGGIEMIFPEHVNSRSQDLPEALHDAGQFYWGRPDAWTAGLRVFDRHSTPLILPPWQVQDIDTEDDWQHAELLWQALQMNAHD
jgi:N-acylneuraminate cytidylyltransferase